MTQEIITYIIIAIALVVATQKIVSKLSKKKKNNAHAGIHQSELNCGNCTAECMLRNTAKTPGAQNTYYCEKEEIKSK